MKKCSIESRRSRSIESTIKESTRTTTQINSKFDHLYYSPPEKVITILDAQVMCSIAFARHYRPLATFEQMNIRDSRRPVSIYGGTSPGTSHAIRSSGTLQLPDIRKASIILVRKPIVYVDPDNWLSDQIQTPLHNSFSVGIRK